MGNLNVEVDELLIRKAKARAALLGIDLKKYVADVIKKDVEENGSKK